MKHSRLVFFMLFATSAHATTINLNWVVDDTNYANTTCESGGDLILPATPPAKYGYTFKGWNILLGLFLNNIDYQSDWSVFTYDGVVTYQTDEATFSLTRTPSSNYGLRGSPSFSLQNRANHKFYITYQIYLSNVAENGYTADTNARMENIQYLRDGISWNKANVWQTASFLATVPAKELPYQLQGYPKVATSNWDVGDYYKIRKYRVFDLTEIFGVGNEPSNLKDIEEALSSRYITESTPGACNFAKTDTYLYAEYTPNSHTCSTGYYLPANIDECTTCITHGICPGGTYAFNETTDQGITGCENGYNLSNGACIGNVITITWDNTSPEDIAINNAGQCIYGGDINTPRTAEHIPGKTFVGWTFE